MEDIHTLIFNKEFLGEVGADLHISVCLFLNLLIL